MSRFEDIWHFVTTIGHFGPHWLTPIFEVAKQAPHLKSKPGPHFKIPSYICPRGSESLLQNRRNRFWAIFDKNLTHPLIRPVWHLGAGIEMKRPKYTNMQSGPSDGTKRPNRETGTSQATQWTRQTPKKRFRAWLRGLVPILNGIVAETTKKCKMKVKSVAARAPYSGSFQNAMR